MKSTKIAIALSALVLSSGAGIAHAQQAPAPTDAQLDAYATHMCVLVVRQMPDDPYGSNHYREFDAYYDSGSGRVQSYGTAAGRFEFDKCMSDHGFPLDGWHLGN